MDVSIIIVNYNTSALILQCLKSVYEKTHGIDFEIIIVDNASPNDDPTVITTQFSSVRIVQSKENIGFGKANNLGARYADGKYLFLLNPDTYLVNNAIYELFSYLEKHSDVAIVGGNLYSEDMQPNISYECSYPGCWLEINNLLMNIPNRLRYGKNYSFNYTSHPLNVSYVVGADLMIRVSSFNLVNGFDSQFFMYAEEVDLCYRIKKNGGKIVSLPTAKIVHLEGKASKTKRNQLTMQLESLIYYYNKNSRMPFVLTLHTINIWLRCLYYSCAKKDISEIFKMQLDILKEIRDKVKTDICSARLQK